ncbi:MAG: hypothetical protein HYT03_01520 [Candidatus Harrisonbacteria bacterium]|nr:hypothetical protein [Candidatus Harrisonbacteria bacterium]
MDDTCVFKLSVPKQFRPPQVSNENQGVAAFCAYDWYFRWMKEYLGDKTKVFLVPCAATKPIHTSPLHRRVYQKYASAYGKNRILLVVSEPVVLINYQHLYNLEGSFFYEFPPKLLGKTARVLFIERLRELLEEKNIAGCLPHHHATLINDAIGTEWINYWSGDLYSMIKKASALNAKMSR